jgi:hypothetical protein
MQWVVMPTRRAIFFSSSWPGYDPAIHFATRTIYSDAKRQHRLDGRVERPAMTKNGELDGWVGARP